MSYVIKGHSSMQGGLRGHSIGEDYPITVSYKGIIGEGHWYVWNALTGYVYASEFTTSACAHAFARYKKTCIDYGSNEL